MSESCEMFDVRNVFGYVWRVKCVEGGEELGVGGGDWGVTLSLENFFSYTIPFPHNPRTFFCCNFLFHKQNLIAAEYS